MGFVAFRVTIEVVLVAGDRIIPIDNVDRSVGTKFDVDGTKVAVLRTQQRFDKVHFETTAILRCSKARDLILLVVAHPKAAIAEFVDARVAARFANPR